jgi:hypothetical protein
LAVGVSHVDLPDDLARASQRGADLTRNRSVTDVEMARRKARA